MSPAKIQPRVQLGLIECWPVSLASQVDPQYYGAILAVWHAVGMATRDADSKAPVKAPCDLPWVFLCLPT